MKIIKRAKYLLFLPFLFSCSSFNSIKIYKRDSLVSYQIINGENPSESKYAVELSFDVKKTLNIKYTSIYAKKDKNKINSIGFAASWVTIDDKYYYQGIKETETIETVNVVYALFSQDVNDYKIYYDNSEINIS